jgi:putative iron-regulated protein
MSTVESKSGRHCASPRGKHLLGAGLIALAAACGGGDDGGALPAETAAAVTTYARIAHASYEDSAAAAHALDAAVQAFVAAPAESSLEAARQAWRAAREPYLQTEVYRFYGGPIDDEDSGPEGLINAWPLDEAYIDYVDGDAAAGIVNDPSKPISAEELQRMNEQGGEENIATGYHAIEFLLWGQDRDPAGPGNRPASDYVVGGAATAGNAERRARYLTTVSRLLVGHLDELVAAWAPDADNYRARFAKDEPREGLRRILTGMIVLSGFETGGERLQTALDSGDQEDEHSCFSDNTHRDMVQDIQGIQNVYRGSYTRLSGETVSGTGIREVVAALDPQLASRLDQEIAASLAAAQALQPPFDREIAADNPEGNARVRALVIALRTQERTLQEVFRRFDLSIPEPQ